MFVGQILHELLDTLLLWWEKSNLEPECVSIIVRKYFKVHFLLCVYSCVTMCLREHLCKRM